MEKHSVKQRSRTSEFGAISRAPGPGYHGSALVKSALNDSKRAIQRKPSQNLLESSDEEEVSQQKNPQLEGNPLLDHLLLSAEERQDYET